MLLFCRTAYHESVLLGQELTQRIHEDVGSKGRSGEADDENDVYDEPVSGSSRTGLKRKSVTQSTAQEMQDILDDSTPLEVDGKYRKLFDMDFMKKAVDQKRERAREDAENVLREIAQMEHAEDSDDENERVSAPQSTSVNKKRSLESTKEDIGRLAQAKADMTGMLGRRGEGSLMNISGQGRKRNAQISSSSLIVAAATSSGVEAPVTTSEEVDDNPWLMAPTSEGSSSSAGSGLLIASSFKVDSSKVAGGLKTNKKAKKEMIVITPVIAAPVVASVATLAAAVPVKANKLPARVPLLMQKSQADLVKMAFSGPDLEEEFNAFKEREIDAELGVDEKRMNILNTGEC